MKQKLTVTVGICAYNEEANIIHMLDSIFEQKARSYMLEKVLVISDNCTDTTVEKVSQFAQKYPQVHIINHSERKGKVARLNELYQTNRSDVLITFDADIILGSEYTIEEMVKIFIQEKNTVMVAAHQIPIRPYTFVGNIIYAGYQMWDMTRLSVKDCDHIQNHYGAASALRKSFIEKIQFPSDITDDRGYLYIRAKQEGNFRYTTDAYILYRPVSTLADFCQLADRSFAKNQQALVRYFSEDVYEMYYIPTKYKLRSIAIMLLKSPFYTSCALILNMYSRLFPKHDALYHKGMWEVCRSTKQAIVLDLRLKRLLGGMKQPSL